MVEEDGVGESVRVDAYVGLLVVFVWQERFDDEVAQFSARLADLLVFVHAFADPLLHLVKCFVYCD